MWLACTAAFHLHAPTTMGNDCSIYEDDDAVPYGGGLSRPDPPNRRRERGLVASGPQSVDTDKVQNLTAAKKARGGGPVVSGQYVPSLPRHLRPEPVVRSASQVFSSKAELTPQVKAATVQSLKAKAYRAIFLHASATGRNAILDLSYNVSIRPCGENGQARRMVVMARGTPTVVVPEIPVESQQMQRVRLPPISIPSY